jgi:ubiquinone/menaquinone biosynthesis C-methylase UbiE
MRATSVERLLCPVCGERLRIEGDDDGEEIDRGSLDCTCGRSFSIEDGIANLVHPTELEPSDAEFQQKYDAGAEEYDGNLAWLFEAFSVDERELRSAMVDLLELRPGARVLDVGCGTGKDSLLILERIGPEGDLFAQDLSIGMLRVARRKLGRANGKFELFQTNASYLPFADAQFDAVFHFGGINEFGELRRALREMTRVVRPGGKVVVGDEGVAPWLRRRLIGRILIQANPLYAHRPPLGALPENALDVRVQWIIGNAFYVIDYRVGDGPPSVDLDLPIPGKGDSLRSRYYQAERPRR